MVKSAPAFTGFTAGELSPRMDGRTDFDKYFQGCKTLNNFLVHPHGGAARRPGAIFISEVKDNSKAIRLIPFEFNVTQTYVMEFGNQYIRFYKDGGQIVDSGSAYEISSPYLENELDEIKFVQSADVMSSATIALAPFRPPLASGVAISTAVPASPPLRLAAVMGLPPPTTAHRCHEWFRCRQR